MATAKKNSPPPVVVPPTTYTLELSEAEAAVVLALVGTAATPGLGSTYQSCTSIYEALRRTGLKCESQWLECGARFKAHR